MRGFEEKMTQKAKRFRGFIRLTGLSGGPSVPRPWTFSPN